MHLLFLDTDARRVQVEVTKDILARILQNCFHLSLGEHFAWKKLFKTSFKDFVTAAHHLIHIGAYTIQYVEYLPKQMHNVGRCLIIQGETATEHKIIYDVVSEPFELLRFKPRLILIPLVEVSLSRLWLSL